MNPSEPIYISPSFTSPFGIDLHAPTQKQTPSAAQSHGLDFYWQEEVRAGQSKDIGIWDSPASSEAMKMVKCVAATDATVLVTGETGTGKEAIARLIHTLSGRKNKALVKLDCTTIPANLAESELFGHEKGAFTGALARKLGRFELADGGTLFLDEIGELPLELQAKLLRVLQEGEFERVGGTSTLATNVRVIAATHRDLAQLCREGRFRTDLFYRLHVFPIALPPLRERREDIPLLVQHFTQTYATKLGKRIATVPEPMMAALCNYAWPGNIRELQHVIERAVILSQGTELALVNGFHQVTVSPDPLPLATLEEVERAHIIKVLEATAWRVSGKRGAAELLGLPPTTLRSRLQKLGIVKKP
jgi:formate hydrogenlyase transcriptional activator